MKINLKGCNCTKTKCQKKYCECFNMNIDCTNLCVCVGCSNNKQNIIVPHFEKKTNYKKYKQSSKLLKEISEMEKNRVE